MTTSVPNFNFLAPLVTEGSQNKSGRCWSPQTVDSGQDSTMWDIIWPQGHRSVSASHHFLLQSPECPCSVRKRLVETTVAEVGQNPVARLWGRTIAGNWPPDREWHGDRCLTPLPPRKIYSCPHPQPVPAPFAAFYPHPRPVTVLFVPIPTPLPQSRANKDTPFPDMEKTMDIILTLCPYVLRFYLDLCKQFLLSAFCA